MPYSHEVFHVDRLSAHYQRRENLSSADPARISSPRTLQRPLLNRSHPGQSSSASCRKHRPAEPANVHDVFDRNDALVSVFSVFVFQRTGSEAFNHHVLRQQRHQRNRRFAMNFFSMKAFPRRQILATTINIKRDGVISELGRRHSIE